MTALLAHHASDATVALGPHGSVSARQLLQLAGAVRDAVREAPGPVVVAPGDRLLFAASLLGCWMAGRPAVLPASAGDVRHLAHGPEHALVLHDVDRPGGLDLRTLERGRAETDPVPAPPDPAPTRTLALLRTSGTTGDPQPHPKTAGQLLGEAVALAECFGLHGRPVVSAVAPSHLYGLLFGILVPLVAGGHLHRHGPRFPQDVHALLQGQGHHRPVLVAVPPLLDALARTEGDAFAPVAAIFSSGGPLHPDTAAALAQRWHPVTEVLGSTETGGFAFRRGPTQAWQPFPGVQVRQGDDHRLHLCSPFLHPDASVPRPCDDRIRLRPDGTFVHLGRLDDLVKVGGTRVSLQGMRAHLLGWPEVQDAAVWSRPVGGARHTEVLAAVASTTLTPEAVRQRLLETFTPVVVPRRVAVVPALPRDEAGKLSADRLAALLPDRWTLPRTEVDDHADRVTVPQDLGYFEGHFPGLPMLPGIVQLTRMVLPAVRSRWPDLTVPTGLRGVKFRHPLRPGDTVEVSVVRAGPEVRFELTSGGHSAASGKMLFAEEGSA